MKNVGLKTMLFMAALLLCMPEVWAFCGFYVAKADAKLFNKSSQVIVVRDGDHTVITMSSDFQGDVKDFAMVVPVPEVLKESDIRVVQQYIFDKFDTYTAPRLVEYWDENPCYSYDRYAERSMSDMSVAPRPQAKAEGIKAKELGVKIEAKYTVGEYDILILSAKESTGLKTWLTDNGYKIPSGADEVLQPYITEGMKFFVVKVNMEEQKRLGVQTLRPLQIQFNSSRFMLPIRLGMANADGLQDMIVYAFTKKGRVETANYRTTKLPTDRDIPEFIQTSNMFGDFYKATYERAWAKEGKNSVMLEYAWDVSSYQSVKCDPCPTPPITFAEMREAGIWWLEPDNWSGSYVGDCFVTRLHVRYGRSSFPQDLMFMNTKDQSNFQGRYVVRHAATGDLSCREGRTYKADLRMRRQRELQELASLTGWDVSPWQSYLGTADLPEPVVPDLPSLTDSALPRQTQCPSCPVGSISPTHRLTPAGFLQRVDSQVAAVATTTEEGDSTVGLQDEQTSVAQSEAFLKGGLSKSKPLMSRNMWLLVIAGAMFVGGVVFRLLGRRKVQP